MSIEDKVALSMAETMMAHWTNPLDSPSEFFPEEFEGPEIADWIRAHGRDRDSMEDLRARTLIHLTKLMQEDVDRNTN